MKKEKSMADDCYFNCDSTVSDKEKEEEYYKWLDSLSEEEYCKLFGIGDESEMDN